LGERDNRAAMARATVVVLDARGGGALPDAAEYAGDEGSNTLVHLAERAGGLELPTLKRLGLGSIVPIRGVAPASRPVLHGRLHPLGRARSQPPATGS
jgi:phosphopentomutase